MNRNLLRWVSFAVTAAIGIGCVRFSKAQVAPPNGIPDKNIKQGFTLPDKEYKVSFQGMGIIREVKVKEGDVIKKGDVLMVQDDREEQAELKLLELDCNDLPIKGAEFKAKAAQVDFDYKDKMMKDGAKVELEWTQKKAEWDIAKVQVEQAAKELEQKKAKRDKQLQHVQNMTLTAQSDGVVKEILNEVGSNVDPTKPVVTVVSNNPLTVEVQVPALASLQLKKDEKMRVSYDKKNWREASVSYLSPQADAASGMRTIRLELANPNGEPSGLQVFVELPEKLLAAVDGK